MNFDDGRVDHGVLHVRLIRCGVEKPPENIGFDPITVAFEHRVPVAEQTRQVPPRAPRSRDPQDRLKETPIVPAATPGVARLAKTMRFHLRPLGVAQNESFHPKLESRQTLKGNPESQQALGCRHISL